MLKLFRKKYKPFSNLTHLALTASDLHARECKVKRDYGRFELLTFYTIYIIFPVKNGEKFHSAHGLNL